VNYQSNLNNGILKWLKQDYKVACTELLTGLSRFTSLSPLEFFAAGTTPAKNLLGTIGDSLHEGMKLWERFEELATQKLFPAGSYHIGWMAMLQAIMLHITDSNWILTRNAHGYGALRRLDALYQSGLRPAARRTLHRKIIAPVFEQAIGRSLAWDVDVGATLAEYQNSPIARDIFGSLYPEIWAEICPDQEFRLWAQRLPVTQFIEKAHQDINQSGEIQKTVKTEETFSISSDGLVRNLSLPTGLDHFLYNQLVLESEVANKVNAQPQMSIKDLRKFLKPGEALILTAAYEDTFLFFVVSRNKKIYCYKISSFGSIQTDALGLLSSSSSAGDIGKSLVVNLYSAVNKAVTPMLHRMELTLASEPLTHPSRKDALDSLLALGEAEPIPICPSSPANFLEAVRRYKTIFWVCSFPLSGAPLHLLMNQVGTGNACSYMPCGSLLGGLRKRHRGNLHSGRALIYSDPTSDLSGCRLEGEWVASFLESNGFEVVHRSGKLATRRFLIEHLHEFSLFHYAGHGIGHEDRYLRELFPLADGTLSSSDLVLARASLTIAFLNACWSGRQRTAPYGEQTGHAGLFLCTGTATVYGPNVPVQDNLAFDTSRRWYELLAEGKSAGEAAWCIHQDAGLHEQEVNLMYRLYGLPESALSTVIKKKRGRQKKTSRLKSFQAFFTRKK
jgi:hypothetical protein